MEKKAVYFLAFLSALILLAGCAQKNDISPKNQFLTQLKEGNDSNELTKSFLNMCPTFSDCLPSGTFSYLLKMRYNYKKPVSDFLSKEEITALLQKYTLIYSEDEREFPFVISIKLDSGYFYDEYPEMINALAGYSAASFETHMLQAYHLSRITVLLLNMADFTELQEIEGIDYEALMKNVCYEDSHAFGVIDEKIQQYAAYIEMCRLPLPKEVYNNLLKLANGQDDFGEPQAKKLLQFYIEKMK